MNDYTRIEAVIRYLDKNHHTQPTLHELASHIGLSSSHFHRLFVQWAGVTPKEFLQCLTQADARKKLQNGASVLNASLEAGLSGPARLHDLCIKLEAATPGELKSGGLGWEIQVGFAPSPFGQIFLAQGPRGICHLSFVDSTDDSISMAKIQVEWPLSTLHRNDPLARKLASQIFLESKQTNNSTPLRTYVAGTQFQVRVWEALLKIPYGKCVTYKQISTSIGKPGASRAVGTAIGRNPIAYLIPCHRVIRETGILGEYRWGSIRKKALVAREGTFLQNPTTFS